MSEHTQEQRIPLVDTALVALFDAALVVEAAFVINLHESDRPGAAATLIAWARSRGLPVEERQIVTTERAYANVHVPLDSSRDIGVLAYRDLTEAERAAVGKPRRSASSKYAASPKVPL